jgi:hypothetical protein
MKPLFKGNKTIQRFPGKGGWTFVEFDTLHGIKKEKFGMIKVKGNVDACEINSIHLMPKGDGNLMLTLNLYVRKFIKKKVGDVVMIEIYKDDEDFPIPEEFLDCFAGEPDALEYFLSLNNSIKRNVIQYVYQATKEETKAKRIEMFLRRCIVHDIHNYSIK